MEEIESAGTYTPGVMRVQLAVGLLLPHYGTQQEAFAHYFAGRGVVSFSYHSKLYSSLIDNIACYP